MRRVFYIPHQRLLALALFLFFVSGVLFPQTIIKEKIKVNPNTKTVSYQPPEFAPCGPWNTSQTDYYNPFQVIWNDNYFNIDPYQQWFNQQGNAYEHYSLDSNHYYNVEITQGAAYCWIEKDVFDPITGYYIGDEILTEPLLNIRGAELIGAGPMVISYCNIWEKFYYPPHYYLRFDKDVPQGTEIIISIQDLTSGNPPIYYHTIVETPLITISNETDSDTLYHNSERYITLYGDVNDSYYNQYCWSCGGALPSSVKFTLEIIEGEEFGSLFDAETEQRGISFSNIGTYWGIGDLFETRFNYIADGIQPDSTHPGIVTIRCTPSDPAVNTVDISFPVGYSNYSDKILVEFTKPKLQPGESTQIILRKINPNGSIEDFPSYQAFEIGMLEGCDLGKIISDNQAGNYFYFAYQPFYFIADTNAVSGVAQIRVGLIEGGGGASKIIKADTSTSNVDSRLLKSGRRNRLNSKLNSIKLSKANVPKVNASCSTSFIKEKDGSGDVVIGGDCEMKKETDENIKSVTKDMFLPFEQEKNDHSNCDLVIKGHKDRAGWISASVVDPIQIRAKNLNFYVKEIKFETKWGYCINKIKEIFPNVEIVDETLDNLTTVFKAQAAIKDFNRFQTNGEFSPGDPLKYYPLPETKAHEHKHFDQYKEKYKEEFNTAFNIINNEPLPPSDWCKPELIETYYNERKKKLGNTIDNAQTNIKKWTENTDLEPEANQAAYDYVKKTLIPAINNKIDELLKK